MKISSLTSDTSSCLPAGGERTTYKSLACALMVILAIGSLIAIGLSASASGGLSSNWTYGGALAPRAIVLIVGCCVASVIFALFLTTNMRHVIQKTIKDSDVKNLSAKALPAHYDSNGARRDDNGIQVFGRKELEAKGLTLSDKEPPLPRINMSDYGIKKPDDYVWIFFDSSMKFEDIVGASTWMENVKNELLKVWNHTILEGDKNSFAARPNGWRLVSRDLSNAEDHDYGQNSCSKVEGNCGGFLNYQFKVQTNNTNTFLMITSKNKKLNDEANKPQNDKIRRPYLVEALLAFFLGVVPDEKNVVTFCVEKGNTEYDGYYLNMMIGKTANKQMLLRAMSNSRQIHDAKAHLGTLKVIEISS